MTSADNKSWRILVACHDIIVAGGLFRFDRVARVLWQQGHELCFLSLADEPVFYRRSDVPVLSAEAASRRCWDATMIPGAGFDDLTIERFAMFRAESYGIRVQHVLNDQRRRERFIAVNRAFQPHLVVFNNTAWEPGSYIDFSADRFHVLLGAVDRDKFRPASSSPDPGRWVIGGSASKNPLPLIEALDHLDETCALHLYGTDIHALSSGCARLVDQGRLRLLGTLEESELPGFYASVDCVAMTETMAGWSNLAAEALACGVPLVCTRHGTSAFARDQETALVVETPTAEALASAIERLRSDRTLRTGLALRGREVIEGFSWESYTQALMSLLVHDDQTHYFCSPERGMFGKWPPSHHGQC